MLILLLVSLFGGAVAFALLWTYGVVWAAAAAVVAGALSIILAGSWLVYRAVRAKTPRQSKSFGSLKGEAGKDASESLGT